MSFAGPYSTTVPPYITATRSDRREMMLMSWLISMVVMPSSDLSSASRSTILDWIVASSPVVGSSAIRSDGSQASAMAIMARWHMPPGQAVGMVVEPEPRRIDLHPVEPVDAPAPWPPVRF